MTPPRWHDAPTGSLWLVDGRTKRGGSFMLCVAHVLDTVDGPNRFQLLMDRGSTLEDIVTQEEITRATPLTAVNADALNQLHNWRRNH